MITELGVSQTSRQIGTWTPYAWMAQPLPAPLSVKLRELDVSVRLENCCAREGIYTLGDLCRWTEARLLQVPNLGPKTIREIKGILEDHGLSLHAGGTEEGAADVDIPARLWHVCRVKGIESLYQLCELTEDELLRCPNFGPHTLRQTKDILAAHGLSLRKP